MTYSDDDLPETIINEHEKQGTFPISNQIYNAEYSILCTILHVQFKIKGLKKYGIMEKQKQTFCRYHK